VPRVVDRELRPRGDRRPEAGEELALAGGRGTRSAEQSFAEGVEIAAEGCRAQRLHEAAGDVETEELSDRERERHPALPAVGELPPSAVDAGHRETGRLERVEIPVRSPNREVVPSGEELDGQAALRASQVHHESVQPRDRRGHEASKTKQVSWNADGSRHDAGSFDNNFRGRAGAEAIARAVLKISPDVKLEEIDPECVPDILIESAASDPDFEVPDTVFSTRMALMG
jgi:uncharacterized protein DUF6367